MNAGRIGTIGLRLSHFYDIGRFDDRHPRGKYYPCERETLENYPTRQEISPFGDTLDWNYDTCQLW